LTKANAKNPFGLTHRQCEIMACLLKTGSYVEIARDLGISSASVAGHMSEIMEKMGVGNRVLAALAWDRVARTRKVFHGKRGKEYRRPVNSVFALGDHA
jgi:DNA-binding CsgD family transcriptional regulator